MTEDLIQQIIFKKKDQSWWLESERKVIGRYGPLFNPSNLDNLTKEDFKSFLLIKNNLHWEGIHRQGNIITADMKILIKFLKYILDENLSIKERLSTKFVEDGGYWVKGMGRAVITPILMVVYPNKYGVWNSRSEAAISKLGLYPKFKSKDSFADKYIKINNIFLDLSSKYQVSLWNLDGVFGDITGFEEIKMPSEEEIVEQEVEGHGITDLANFGMESHLEDFLISNWNKTVFGKDYDLLYDGEDLISQQYQTQVGEIDILALSKDKQEYLIIELKKGRSTDAVVGQILRYISWVKENLAKDKRVKGTIVVLGVDDKLKYSLMSLQNISLYTYQVDFKLQKEN